MTAPSKVALDAQIEEMGLTLQAPPPAATAGAQAARIRARKAILATLQFCRDNEAEIRAFVNTRKSGRRYRIVRGQFCWSMNGTDWEPMAAALANDVLAQLCGVSDAP